MARTEREQIRAMARAAAQCGRSVTGFTWQKGRIVVVKLEAGGPVDEFVERAVEREIESELGGEWLADGTGSEIVVHRL